MIYMPHQCVRCGKMYEDGSRELLEGCSCGAKFFFFVKREALEARANEVRTQLSKKELRQMETDVREILGEPEKTEKPVILDVETIRVLGPGKYELDVMGLFRDSRVVIQIGDGKYRIDIASMFKKSQEDAASDAGDGFGL